MGSAACCALCGRNDHLAYDHGYVVRKELRAAMELQGSVVDALRARVAKLEAEVAHAAPLIRQWQDERGWYNEVAAERDALRARVAELEDERRWISVDDRLPDGSRLVIMWVPNARHPEGGRALSAWHDPSDTEQSWHREDQRVPLKPSHWREWPKGPVEAP